MNKTYEVLKKDIERFKKKYGKVEVVALPIDQTSTITDIDLALEQNPKDFYIAILRPLTRIEMNMFNRFLLEDNRWKALEVILENCWLMGDNQLLDDDDYFLALANTFDLYNTFSTHTKRLPIFIDEKNYSVYIRKSGDTKINSIDDINETDFHKFVFRKANRNDIIMFNQQGVDDFMNQEQFLINTLVEGDENLIRNDDEIFYSFIDGHGGNISNILINQRVGYLKKN